METDDEKSRVAVQQSPLLRTGRRDFLIGGVGVVAGGAAGLLGRTRHGSAAPGIASALPSASGEAAGAEPLTPLNRFPRMVHDHFARLIRAAQAIAEKRRAAVTNASAAQAYVQDARARVQRVFGTWPQRTPLKPRVTGVLERDSYRIEKVIFESRPMFPVTANLYIPKRRNFPLPGVIGACGHAGAGKAGHSYQAFAQTLARMGYVVLIFDPISQAERVQLYDGDRPVAGRGGISEHVRYGLNLAMVGDSLAAWSAWDGIRAIDYLLTRKEVDRRHVGVTGNSGGGLQTTWLVAADPRCTMAAPSCFVTTFLRNFENEVLGDTEVYPPNALAEALDHSDFLAAFAPKPLLLLGREKDYFDVRGLEETHRRLQLLYRQLGAEERLGLHVASGNHGFGVANREAMYRFFNDITKISQIEKEPEFKPEEEKDLWCTPNGRAFDASAKKVASIISERCTALKASRGQPRGPELKQRLVQVLGVVASPPVPDYRILRPWPVSRQYPSRHAATYLVETEAGITIPVTLLSSAELWSRPPRGVSHAVLYVSHQSADVELRTEPLAKEIASANPRALVYACDVRGIGDSRSNVGLDGVGGADYFYAVHGGMLAKPYVGQRTQDVLSVLTWLKAQGHETVHLAALGWGTIPSTFAAILSELVTDVTLKFALTSYTEIAESDGSHWPPSLFPPDVLHHFDLPDCYAELEAKRFRQIQPLQGKRRAPKIFPT